VASVLRQTFSDWELVIVDNASTDRTMDVLAKINDPRIRVYSNEKNIGAVPNFNRAVSLARGKYIKVLCSDDLLYPRCLEAQVEALDQDPDGGISMVCCGRDIVDHRGRCRLTRTFPGRPGRMGGQFAINLSVRRGTNIFGEPGGILLRAERLKATGDFNPEHSYCVDLDLWFRLLMHGDLYALDDVLCAFRITPESWSATLAGRQRKEFTRLILQLNRTPGVSLTRGTIVLGRIRALTNAIMRRAFTRYVTISRWWTK
jgi:glycosyltransferase involved in cell wall biosynthesis